MAGIEGKAAGKPIWREPWLYVSVLAFVAGLFVRDVYANHLIKQDIALAEAQMAEMGPPPAEDIDHHLATLTVPAEAVFQGAMKDAIPAITDPAVDSAAASPVTDDARVVGVEVNGEVRAYPVGILNWHEVVNDTLGGEPIAVTFCPLCDSAAVFDRTVAGEVMEFGVSGYLHNSNVLLYDRQADVTQEGLWSQVMMEAVSGPHAGTKLRARPAALTTWAAWRERHPDTTVISYETGHERNYTGSPYAFYLQEKGPFMFPVDPVDERLAPYTPVVGMRVGDATRAYPVPAVAAEGALTDTLDGVTVTLTAEADGEGVHVATEGEADVVHTFWFAWAALHQDTEIHGGAPEPAATP